MMLLTATTAWAQDEISGLTYNTEGGYYVIPDAAALEALATYVNDNGKTSDKTFKLTADIDFADVPLNTDSNGNPYNFTPIGFGGKSFSGKFYGNGNTISNLIYETNPSVSGRGLFGKTEGATIDGVTISGITITGTAFYMGGLVGFCGGVGGTISNSTADVDVTGTESTGGFVGHINYGGMEISDCRANGFTSGGAKVGGSSAASAKAATTATTTAATTAATAATVALCRSQTAWRAATCVPPPATMAASSATSANSRAAPRRFSTVGAPAPSGAWVARSAPSSATTKAARFRTAASTPMPRGCYISAATT
jgi:hypothetical protein